MEKLSYANLVSAVLHILGQIYFKLQNVMVFAISKIPKTICIGTTGCLWKGLSVQHYQCYCFNGISSKYIPILKLNCCLSVLYN